MTEQSKDRASESVTNQASDQVIEKADRAVNSGC